MFLMAFICFQEKIQVDAFTGERDNQNLNIKYEIISQSKSPKDKVSSYDILLLTYINFKNTNIAGYLERLR